MLIPATAEDPRRMPDDLLLARLLGGSDAEEVAARLLREVGGLRALAAAEVSELARVPGVRPAAAARVHAALLLGRRAQRRPAGAPGPIQSAAAAAAWLVPGLTGLPEEELHALYVDRRLLPLGLRELTRGSDRFTVVDPRQIFRPALALGATAVVLAHNHPSGDPTPSREDADVTRRVASAGQILGVQLIDHLVVADEAWVSLAERGLVPAAEPGAGCWTR
jgi:DNA repair protein RadC